MTKSNQDLQEIKNTPYSRYLGLDNLEGNLASNVQSGAMFQPNTSDSPTPDQTAVNPNSTGVRLAIQNEDAQPQVQTVGHDPSLQPYAQSLLDRYDSAPIDPQDKASQAKFRPQLIKILRQYGTMDQIAKAPPNVRASLYGISQLGDQAYGTQGKVTDPDISDVNSGWKCNIFASKCWARGAGLGYNVGGNNPAGYPTYAQPGQSKANGDTVAPTTANDIYGNRYNMSNFSHTGTGKAPRIGDIFAFTAGQGERDGHSGIFLGGDLGVYAGENSVKLGTMPHIQADKQTKPPTFRTYTPGH